MSLTKIINQSKNKYSRIPAGPKRQEILKEYQYDCNREKHGPEDDLFYCWHYITQMWPAKFPYLYLSLSLTKDQFIGFQVIHDTLRDQPNVSFWSVCPRNLKGKPSQFVDFKYKRFATALVKQLLIDTDSLQPFSGQLPPGTFTFNSEELIKALALSLYALRNKKTQISKKNKNQTRARQ